MNSATVKIYEFSTGIQAERTSDGWVSRGFTGEYMNKTIDPIPVAIQSAIANREFAVAEGASSDEPAIIGREVRGGGEVWSAIAVVTRGRDDRGRSASMYRYFFCEGLGNLWKILAWMEPLRQAGRMPIFNPFETKIVGQPNECPVNNRPEIPIKKELQYLLINNEAPIIIPSGQPCMASILNEMAAAKASENGQPVAWAFKAEALEQPRSFQVIQPASAKAEQLLQRAIASTPQYTAPIAGEQEVKSAIKGLISRDKVKLESVQIIGAAINQIKDSDWEVIFNGQGASQALSQGIYSPQMVRLLTLRAMVIPQTLPKFVDWMQKRGKQEDHKQISEDFQLEISNSSREIPENTQNLRLKVTQGVKLIIPMLVDQPKLLGGVVWLLSSPSGFWKQIYSQQVAVDIDHDFKLMSDKVTRSTNVQFKVIADREWEELSSQLQIYWQYPSHPHQEKYQPLADLFGELRNFRIAAFFYHVASGEVPKNIFRKISNRGGLYSKVYEVDIKRQVPLTEVLGVWIQEFFAITIPIGEKYMPLWVALLILLICTSLGFVGGLNWKISSLNQNNNSANNEAEKNIGSSTISVNPSSGSNNDKPSKSSVIYPLIPPQTLESGTGKENFDETKAVIERIIDQIKQEEDLKNTGIKIDKDTVVNALKVTLAKFSSSGITSSQLSYAGVIEKEPLPPEELKQSQEKWVTAIYLYQKTKGLNNGNPVGYLKQNGSVKDILKKDIIKNLENNAPDGK